MKTSLFAILVSLATASSAVSGTYTVLSTEDSGPGTLRQATLDAVAGDTIGFGLPAPSTITLTSGELLVDKDLEIVGPGKDDLTIARSSAADAAEFRIFHISSVSTVTLSGMTITNGKPDNFTGGGNGGGILSDPGCTLTVSGAVISGNAPVHGGGAPSGGGVYNGGTLTLIDSTVSNNSTGGVFGGDGGGLLNQGTCIITGCTFSGNDKGGIVSLGSLTVTNRTITGNLSLTGLPSSAGGIVNGAEASLTNCTITGNSTVLQVGGIDNYGTMGLKNCVIALNTAPNSAPSDPDIRGTFISNGYNLIGDNSGATIAPAMGDQIGSAGSPIDPMLGPLADNGGPTETHALLPGSPAIDKAGPVDGLTSDQRGRFRPVDDPAIAAAEAGDESDIGAFEMQAAQALNISTRLRVLTGQNILDGGFIITGTEPKKVFIRGLGPSLASQGVPGFLPNPFLELHHDADIIAANDNWKSNQETEIEATGIPPGDDAESAIIMTLWPGAYTAILEDLSGNSGVGLIEVYDLDAAAVSNLANISTRGYVDMGDNVMIGGFIVGAGEGLPNQIIVRAIGPSLSSADIVNPLQDPDLELHDQSGTLIASNDNWKDTQQTEIEATGVAPTDEREAAIVRTLTSGQYTAIVRGVNETAGVALVEVFDLH